MKKRFQNDLPLIMIGPLVIGGFISVGGAIVKLLFPKLSSILSCGVAGFVASLVVILRLSWEAGGPLEEIETGKIHTTNAQNRHSR